MDAPEDGVKRAYEKTGKEGRGEMGALGEGDGKPESKRAKVEDREGEGPASAKAEQKGAKKKAEGVEGLVRGLPCGLAEVETTPAVQQLSPIVPMGTGNVYSDLLPCVESRPTTTAKPRSVVLRGLVHLPIPLELVRA